MNKIFFGAVLVLLMFSFFVTSMVKENELGTWGFGICTMNELTDLFKVIRKRIKKRQLKSINNQNK